MRSLLANFKRPGRSLGSSLLLLLLLIPLTSLPCSASTRQQFQDVANLLEKNQFIPAIDLLHDLEASLLDPTQVKPLLAVAYLGRGYQLLAYGDFPAARKAFFEGRQYNEDDIRLWQGEAMSWFKEGRYAEAASLLDQALGIWSESSDLYALLGQAFYAGGRMAEAVDALARSYELGGRDDTAALLAKVQREWQVEQEMGQEVRGHFQLSSVDGGQAATLSLAILETLEDAYTELGSTLAYYPDVRVPVLLYSRRDFSAVTHSPDWAGASYDGKIRLPLGGLHHMTDQLAAMLYHEYAHVLVHFMTNQHAPVWLNEGLAEEAGRRMYAATLVNLQAAKNAGQLIAWSDLDGSFAALAVNQVPLAYEQSFSIVHFIIDRYGWHKMEDLLIRLGKGQPWQAAFADVYRDYGLDWSAIVKEWQTSLN